jgi:hypothetical protein
VTQLALDLTARLVRASDPETSRQAADRIRPKLTEPQVRVLEAYRVRGPMTARDCEALDEFRDCGFSTVRKRISELTRSDPPQLVIAGKENRGWVYRLATTTTPTHHTGAGRGAL